MARRYHKHNPSHIYVIYSGSPAIPKRNGPRSYDEAHITAIAVSGLADGTYKTYAHAARELQHLAKRVGDVKTRVDRLQRKISKAWRSLSENL